MPRESIMDIFDRAVNKMAKEIVPFEQFALDMFQYFFDHEIAVILMKQIASCKAGFYFQRIVRIPSLQ